MQTGSPDNSSRIEELEGRLAEAEQLIEAIKAGEVDAFALNKNNLPGIFTLQSGDYAYRVLVENFSEGALNLSEDGMIVYTNTSFPETVQLTYEKVIGKNILEFIDPESIEDFTKLFKKGLAGQSKGEINLIAADAIIPVYISFTSLFPTLPTVGMIVSDLRERKTHEQTLIQNKELEIAKRKIEESQAQYQTLIYTSPSAIGILKGEDLVITIANDAIIQIWGKGKEIIGKKYFEALPELAEQGYKEIYSKVYKTGIPFNDFEIPISIVQDGKATLKYYNFILYPQRSAGNKVTGIGIIATEVTSQAIFNNQIKESEERFRQLATSVPQIIWTSKPDGSLDYLSPQWEEYTGQPVTEGLTNSRDTIHAEDLPLVLKSWEAALKARVALVMNYRLLNKHTGEYRWHSATITPLKDEAGNIIKWIGASTDIHEQKVKEEKKDEFISIASHELKTPLTTAKAYLQMLELSVDEKNKEASLYTKKAIQSVERINELIGELLDVSKIRLGKMDYSITSFNFNDMVDNTIENMQLTSLTHTIVKTGQVTDKVTGDKKRLQQVIINLLSNAIKYSPDSDQVFLDLGQEKDTIKVSVSDSGIGMSRQNIDKIFDRYHRIEEHAIRFQGLGIGLFISYEIIQRHHGKLWAESKPGKGSTFHFTIPVNYTTK